MNRALPLLLALAGACSAPPSGTVLWHAYHGAEADALAASAARWNAAHPDAPLELVAVPYSGFGDKLTSAIPNGNGPDLFIYPQDRIGNWADSGAIEPIEFWVDEARASRFSDDAVEAMAYKGSLWGLPVAAKSLALYYRPDLVTHPAATTDELFALAPKMAAKHGYALAYANIDLYGHAPWLFGFGGKLLDAQGNLAIATPEAAAAMTFARSLVVKGVAPDNCQAPLVGTLFNEGKTAMAISGPWFQFDIAADVPWAVAPLPVISATGKRATPFYGAEGILMSARAHDKEAAFAVMDFLTSDAQAIERAKVGRQVVPNVRAWDEPAIANDPVLRAFKEQLASTVAMPKDPAMRVVWTPYQTALGNAVSGGKDPGAELLSTEREVHDYVSGAK